MEWHPNLKPTFIPRPPDQSSFNFLFNYNFEPPFHAAGVDVKQPEMVMAAPPPERGGYAGGADGCSFSSQFSEKKKRLTTDQLESLENSFQEEIKLDPDRKMKLARELGLQPRQVAVWFQNRRARWKAKQLERLYDSVRLELDAVSREKQKLQEEVVKLRAILMEQANRNNKQVSIGCTELSGDDTVESTSAAAGGAAGGGGVSPQRSAAECQYLFSAVDEYNAVASPVAPYWPANIPSYPC